MADTERVKPRALYAEEAIAAALESRWGDAVSINQALVERHGPDEESCNRLGKAQTELGRLQEGLASYRASLELNALNLIAQKQVRRITALLDAETRPMASAGVIDVDLFTEEPGKSARSVLTPPRGGVTVAVAPGDVVQLIPSGNQLLAETSRGVALGAVESKLSHRLRPLTETGNRYAAAVARVEEDRIEIIIRETFQAPENSRKTSFPISRHARRDDFRPYAKESLLAERGVGDDGFGDVDDELVAEPAAAGEGDDLAGMQELDDEFEPAAVAGAVDSDADDDDSDDDERPEDHY